MESENVKQEFAQWLTENAPNSYGQYLGNSNNSIIDRLDEINAFFPDQDLFEVEDNNPEDLMTYLFKTLRKQGRLQYPDFDRYNKNNGNGIPQALLGENNYFRFLRSKFQTGRANAGPNYWIFQCSPEIYDIEEALRADHVKSWKVAAHTDTIKTGDKVIIWKTGNEAGCYGLAEVNSKVGDFEEDDFEKRYYKIPDTGENTSRVKLKIIKNLADDPVLWEEIKDLLEFEKFNAGYRGTNFSATKEQFQTISDLTEESKTGEYWEVKKIFPEGEVEKFLSILRKFIQENNLDPYDERLTFRVRSSRKRLVLIIGKRYALAIDIRKGKVAYSVVHPEILSEIHGEFTNYKGETEVYWNEVRTLEGIEDKIQEGLNLELERNYKSPTRNRSNHEFIADVMQNETGKNTIQMKTNSPLNTILYGPPGTGKTYHSKELAVEIANPEYIPEGTSEEEKRASINREYKRLFGLGQIVFTTFHQSFSYEDFIEGIKPLPPKADGEVGYEVQNGIFKTLCERAMEEKESFNFEDAYTRFIEEIAEKGNIGLETPVQNKPFKVHINSNGTSVATPKTEKATEMGVTKTMLREYIVNGKIRDWKPYTTAIGNYVKEHFGVKVEEVNNKNQNFVIIIDEINRGNVSSILGELITLLEPDKRLGSEESLEVELPYSKEPFSVPSNVFVIGTMNTADRSVEALDTALRRRFTFEEIMPLPHLLKEITFKGFNLAEVLETINSRIEALLDRDHTIGHSYFIKIKSGDKPALKEAFENRIIPLLQEYFYHDYEKIALILGEGFVEKNEGKVQFAHFQQIEDPEILPSFELTKEITDIEAAIRKLLNLKDEKAA